MWHLKTTVIPIVIEALGMIKRKSEDHIKGIPGNPCLQELQKIVLNGTAHLLRRVLSIRSKILFIHNQTTNNGEVLQL